MVGANGKLRGEMRVKSANVISEVQKVRFLVMDIIYRNPDRSVMIPSSNELAAHFDIARYTVRLALEKMTEEGYLFTKRGTGTFTIPHSVKNGPEKLPLIGVRIGPGDQFYYDAPMLNELGTFMQVISQRDCNVRILTDSADNVDEYQRILDNAYIDGLITISTPSEFSILAAQRMPVVSVGFEAQGANSIIYGGSKVAEKLLKLNRTGQKLSVLNIGTQLDLKYLNETLMNNPEIDFINDSYSVRDEESMALFKQVVSRMQPDVICLRKSQLSKVADILNEVKIAPDKCRLLKLDASDSRPFESGMKLQVDLGHVMTIAVDEMIRLMSGKGDVKPFRHVIDYDLIYND